MDSLKLYVKCCLYICTCVSVFFWWGWGGVGYGFHQILKALTVKGPLPELTTVGPCQEGAILWQLLLALSCCLWPVPGLVASGGPLFL